MPFRRFHGTPATLRCMTRERRFRLTPIEIAMGDAIGLDPLVPPLERPPEGTDPIAMLEEAILPALLRPPCVIAFSGGRDSSAVLAVATTLAKREGLAPPIPISKIYPSAPETDESKWQELVIRHVGAEEWERVEINDELDLLGPVARGLLLKHGLLWPPNFYTFAPLIERARSGSFMSGSEGDELFGGWRWRPAADVMTRRAPLSPRSILKTGLAHSPQPIRRLVLRRRWELPPMEWLRPHAAAQARELVVRHQASEPATWERRVDWYARQRWLGVAQHATELIAADHDAVLVDPLLDRRFLAALGRAAPRWGLGNRTQIMAALFGELLPRAVIERRDKVLFTLAFWGEESRAFSGSWNGEGVEGTLVDKEGLKRAWGADVPDARTAPLLQAAWLHRNSDDSDHGVDDVIDHIPSSRT